MVYLIGVDHKSQYLASKSSRSLLQFLQQKVRQLSIVLIAEELSQEAIEREENLRKTKVDSTARVVAEITDIEHRFCDPNSSERRTLGIPSTSDIRRKLGLKAAQDEAKVKEEERKYWPVREEFWLEQIKDRIEEKLMLVCGACHIQGFRSLLERKNCKVEILSEDWEKEHLR